MMGQQEVYKILTENEGKRYTVQELRDILHATGTSLFKAMRQLTKYDRNIHFTKEERTAFKRKSVVFWYDSKVTREKEALKKDKYVPNSYRGEHSLAYIRGEKTTPLVTTKGRNKLFLKSERLKRIYDTA